MCQFPLFETIAILDGKPQNLAYHQARFEQAMRDYFQVEPLWQLADLITVPKEYQQGLVRCRLDYNACDYRVQFFVYTPRKFSRLQCVYTENLDYRFKYADRKRLDSLKTLQSDEVIIINNGCVSDCTIGNLLFFKAGKWYSSCDYLLKGTQLSYLVDQGVVELVKIPVETISTYEKVMIVNALNSFKNGQIITISNISF